MLQSVHPWIGPRRGPAQQQRKRPIRAFAAPSLAHAWPDGLISTSAHQKIARRYFLSLVLSSLLLRYSPTPNPSDGAARLDHGGLPEGRRQCLEAGRTLCLCAGARRGGEDAGADATVQDTMCGGSELPVAQSS
jgi:hypothetical protein